MYKSVYRKIDILFTLIIINWYTNKLIDFLNIKKRSCCKFFSESSCKAF